ncbi:MAG: methyltransferase domain-containing protein [Holophagaceae bacterium]|nr:methyltransferase domain-containing protein [Holophagaceae bacterium]
MEELLGRYALAGNLMEQGRLDEALEILYQLRRVNTLAPVCHYRIAQISNMLGNPEVAWRYYYKAFDAMPNIASVMLPREHTSNSYVFEGKKDECERDLCPLCGGGAEPRWCYPLVEALYYNPFFNPIRLWMYCEPCHHMFAHNFPEKLFIYNDNPRRANPAIFPYYSTILSNIRCRGFATGMSLLEVGIGACECMLAAREIGYDTFGIDVIERHVSDARSLYGFDAETADFLEFETDLQWDVIIMGDVLEHVSDPLCAISKAESLLKDNGALWISTPSFESAFTQIAGHNDVMRKQQYHLNYFSRQSLYSTLERNNLAPIDYQISSHFNGSMEVVAVKTGRSAVSMVSQH